MSPNLTNFPAITGGNECDRAGLCSRLLVDSGSLPAEPMTYDSGVLAGSGGDGRGASGHAPGPRWLAGVGADPLAGAGAGKGRTGSETTS